MNKRGIVGCLAMLLAQISMAGTLYGDITYTSSDGDLPSSDFVKVDNNDTGWQLSGGYDVNEHFAVEFGYADLGQQSVEITPPDAFVASPLVGSGPGYFNPFTGSFSSALTSIPTIVTKTKGFRLTGIGKLLLFNRLDMTFQGGVLVPRYKMTTQRYVIDFPSNGDPITPQDFRLVRRTETSNEPELFVGLGLHWKLNPTMGVKLFWEKLNDLGNEDTLEQDIDTYNLALRYQF